MHKIKQIPQHVKWQIQAQFFMKHLWGADNRKCLHHDGLWVGVLFVCLFVCFYVKVNCRKDESLRCNRFFFITFFFSLSFFFGGWGVNSNTKLAIENTEQLNHKRTNLHSTTNLIQSQPIRAVIDSQPNWSIQDINTQNSCNTNTIQN